MSTLKRYTLLQIPGWLVVGAVLVAGWELDLVSPATAAILFALWVAKDAVAYPLVRKAYERRSGTAADDLIGSRGEVQRELAPAGLVRIRGELWRSEVEGATPPIPAGSTVIVRAARGLTLIVEPEAGDRKSTPTG